MEAKFKVGDKVTVIGYPRDCPYSFTSDMLKKYGGKVYTIREVFDSTAHEFTVLERYTEWDQHYYRLQDTNNEKIQCRWSNMMFVDGDVKPEDNPKPAIDSFEPIYHSNSNSILKGKVVFTKGSDTKTYSSKPNGLPYPFWYTVDNMHSSAIFDWLGLEDLANDIAILATGTEHPCYERGYWPYSITKYDNDTVMQYVIYLVQKYNEFKSKDKLREYVKSRLAKSPTKASPEPDLTAVPLASVATTNPSCLAATGTIDSSGFSKSPIGKLRPADKEVKLSINKRKSYKVKSR